MSRDIPIKTKTDKLYQILFNQKHLFHLTNMTNRNMGRLNMHFLLEDEEFHCPVSLPRIMGILATPPKATPPRNKALLRAY